MADDPIRVGIVLREHDLSAWAGRLPELADRAVAAGIDHLTVGDHSLQLWAGFGDTRAGTRERLSAAMEAAYATPFERFERHAPYGPPPVIAEALSPYLAVGCRRFNFVPEAMSLTAAFDAAAEVKALLS